MELIKKAAQFLENAYAPYSRFRVGAVVIGGSGKTYGGCNVENASYGATICAERSAIFSAIAGGEKKIKSLVLVTDTPDICTPCGMCRQVIAEFAVPDTEILCATKNGKKKKAFKLSDLLPHAFSKSDL